MANPLAPSKTSFTFPSRSSLTLHAGLFLLLLLGTISSWSFAKVLCFFPKVFGLPQLCPSSHPLHLLFIQSDCPEHIVSSSIELFLSFKAIPKHPTWIINVHIKNFIAGIFPEIWIDLTTALLLVFTCKLFTSLKHIHLHFILCLPSLLILWISSQNFRFSFHCYLVLSNF